MHNKAAAGVVVSLVFASSSVAQRLTRSLTASAALVSGCTALVLSAVLIAVALDTESVPTFVVAAVVAGIGQGMSFNKGHGAVVDSAPSGQSGEISSAYFVVAYVGVSLPVVGLGFAA
ncbi:PucC family protein [Nocardia kruczakiae]|uniref:PucC family protein n=1 Tax=Nocardia kruczakiae TaxID=261477 RepID=UPI0007A4467B|nr:PucC family protein [Nocardia kruczakiae]